MKLLPPDKVGEGKVGERRERMGGERKGMKGKGGAEDFRAFPQFQICHYTPLHLTHRSYRGQVFTGQMTQPTVSKH